MPGPVRLAVVLLALACQCGDLPRDNPLDPKNPRSQRERVILAEAFVSDDPAAAYCGYALDALAQLEAEVGSAHLLIAEYHLPNPGKWVDPHAVPEARLRYEELAQTGLGIPDVFFDGPAGRVQGAYSAATAYDRYRRLYDAHRTSAGLFTIEGEVARTNAEVKVQVSLARLGSQPARALLLRAVLVRDLGMDRHHHVVKAVFSGQRVEDLQAGEVVQSTFLLPASAVSGGDESLIVFVESGEGANRVVEQAASLRL
ncbi:MAG: hypothetical protein H5U38_06920 [Calditrichaeota bacterium]|nr:hypothetical protein [Calditrichota bacterium]